MPDGAANTADADPSLKSRAFDSSKISAHHATIPTQARAVWTDLSEDERKIYQLVARAYVLQFLPPRTYRQTRVVLETGGETFGATGSVTLTPGWRAAKWGEDPSPASGDDTDETEDAGDAGDDLALDLSTLTEGGTGQCSRAWVEDKTTKPPSLYTMASLLTDLTRVARYIRDEKLRSVLVERDRQKAGESGGIGTPATRDTIIATLIQRGFIEEKGKHVVSTALGQAFYDRLPPQAVWPDMTALWHEQQKSIAVNPGRMESLVSSLERYVAEEIERARTFTMSVPEAPKCPLCDAPLRRFNGRNGAFWRCLTFNVEDKSGCAYTADDLKGKPVERPKATVSQQFACMACGSGLTRRASKTHKGAWWWGCSGFPSCKQTYKDAAGRPDYGSAP